MSSEKGVRKHSYLYGKEREAHKMSDSEPVSIARTRRLRRTWD